MAEPRKPNEMPAEDGVYYDVLDLHYHQWEAVSQSTLRMMDETSPAHARAKLREGVQQTDDMLLGSACHAAVLQPEHYARYYRKRPEGHANSNAYKAAVAKTVAENPFVSLLKDSQVEAVERVRAAARDHPVLSRMLSAATHREVSIAWTEEVEIEAGEEVSVRLKGRLDMVVASDCITDLKTTVNAAPGPDGFGKQAWNMGLLIQAGLYLRGAHAVGIDVPSSFCFAAVEKKGPHLGVSVQRVTGAQIEYGQMEADRLIRTWARCKASGEWPSYPERVVELELPYWAERRMEEGTGFTADDYEED